MSKRVAYETQKIVLNEDNGFRYTYHCHLRHFRVISSSSEFQISVNGGKPSTFDAGMRLILSSDDVDKIVFSSVSPVDLEFAISDTGEVGDDRTTFKGGVLPVVIENYPETIKPYKGIESRGKCVLDASVLSYVTLIEFANIDKILEVKSSSARIRFSSSVVAPVFKYYVACEYEDSVGNSRYLHLVESYLTDEDFITVGNDKVNKIPINLSESIKELVLLDGGELKRVSLAIESVSGAVSLAVGVKTVYDASERVAEMNLAFNDTYGMDYF